MDDDEALKQIGRCAFGIQYPDDPWRGLPCALKRAKRYCATHNRGGLDLARIERVAEKKERLDAG